MRYKFLMILAGMVMISCSAPDDEKSLEELNPLSKEMRPNYAQGFKIEYFEEGKLISISNAYKDMAEDKQFWIPQRSGGSGLEGVVNIPFNPERILCMSTTHLFAFEWLGEADRVIGISSAKNVYSEHYRKGIESKAIADLGGMNDPNYEQILALNPDLVIVYGIGEEIMPVLRKFEDLEIPYLLNGEYMESTPLAQAEWIKLFGVIVGKEEMADSLFTYVEQSYLSVKENPEDSTEKPKVLINAPWEGVWYLPNSSSFAAKYIEDAGGRFAIEDEGQSAWKMLDEEAVFEQANDADIWLNTGNHFSLTSLKSAFSLATEFQAYQNGEVFNNLKRVNNAGGNDYWESGIYRPDLVLNDLVQIFYKDSLNSDDLVFFIRLKQG